MLLTHIHVDGDNVELSGGKGLVYRNLIEYFPGTISCTAHFTTPPFSRTRFFDALRKDGVRVRTHEPKRSDGRLVGYADLVVAVTAIEQAAGASRIVLLTGDCDYVPLVEYLQRMGKRVEVMGFRNPSHRLVAVADRFIDGLAVPGLVSGGGRPPAPTAIAA